MCSELLLVLLVLLVLLLPPPATPRGELLPPPDGASFLSARVHACAAPQRPSSSDGSSHVRSITFADLVQKLARRGYSALCPTDPYPTSRPHGQQA